MRKPRAKSRPVDAKKEISRRLEEEWNDASSDVKSTIESIANTDEVIDVEDVVYATLAELRSPKTRHKLILQGDGVIKGVTEELGLPAKELQKALGVNAFATRANGGISLQKMAENIVADLDRNITGASNIDVADVRDMLIEAIQSAGEPADISYHRARRRIDVAEKVYADWKRNELELEAEYEREADAERAAEEFWLTEQEKAYESMEINYLDNTFADELAERERIINEQNRISNERINERGLGSNRLLRSQQTDTSGRVEEGSERQGIQEEVGDAVSWIQDAETQRGQVGGTTQRKVEAEVAKASKAKTAKKKAGEDIAKAEEAMKAEKAKRELKTKEDIEKRLAEIREGYEADKEGRDIQTQADAMVELYGGYANAPKDVKAKIDAQVAKLSARRQELAAEERELEKKLATLAKEQTSTTLDTRTEGQKEDGGYSENSANSGAIGLARMRLEGERLSLNGTDPDKGGVRFSVEDSGDKKEKHSVIEPQDLTTIVVSTKNADAKIISNKNKAKENLNKLSYEFKNKIKTRGFLSSLKESIAGQRLVEQSSYFDFNTPNSEITLRISNHNAKGENFDGDREAISVVIKSERTKNTFEEGKNLTEFVYFKERIAKADGNTLSQIAESIKDLLDIGVYVDKSGLAEINPDSMRFRIEEEDDYSGEGGVRFAVVEDEELIKRLDADEKVIGYRNVVLNEDGTFESPMANSLRSTDRKAKEKTGGFELNKWESSEERPHLVDENGKITLVKPDGKAVEKVDYNPYIHNRLNMVNKQFKQAWERPNLVYIKTEIPLSDLESGYHAEKAKLPVGEHKWNGGNLILSRYDKPVEICDWNDVADDWQASFKKEGINFDIIPPALLPILEERGGVRFSVEDSGDKKVEDGVRFRFSETEEEFRATQKEAVEKKGIVMPNLADAVVEIVDVPRHNFKGRGIDAINKAKEWANTEIIGSHTYHQGKPDEFEYLIDEKAIDKFLSKSSTAQSDNLGIHLAVLKKLPDVINASIEAEIHADYKKENGKRAIENGVNDANLLIHRLYGAVKIDDKIYRAKTTIHERLGRANKAYDYKVTEVKLIVSGSSASNARTNLTSINGTKLLQGVEKSYDKGKYLLGGSVKNVKSSEEDDDYSGEGGVRFRFIGEEGAKSMDKKEGTTARMDNLAVAKKMLSEYSYKEVKMATGWEKGMDGKWRYETPDFEKFDVNGNLKFVQRHPDYARYRELVKKSKKPIDK